MTDETSTGFDLLTGIRVVDFTQFEAGPSCTEALAWMGAEVVKIENPQRGDPGRRLRPGAPDDDPWYFNIFNANKKSLAVDLKHPGGKDLVRRLLARADICVENFAPGTIERLGFGWEAVHTLNPRLIYCQVKGFGEGSPHESGLAFDMIAQASGGTMSVTGEKDGAPLKPGISLGDTGTGMLMAATIAAALFRRQTTGQGCRLAVAMQDAMLHYMRTNFATTRRTGRAVGRGGAKVPGVTNAPMGLYPCAPGGPNDYVYIMTSRANPEHWTRLLTLIGRPELIGDARYATPADRLAREAEVDALIADWTRHHTKTEAMALVSGVGVPAGAVFDTLELSNDPSFARRGIVQSVARPDEAPMNVPTWPVRIDGHPARVVAAPRLGADTDAVLASWLELDPARIAGLRAEGAVA